MKSKVIIVRALFIKRHYQEPQTPLFVWRVENQFYDIATAKQFVAVLNESPYLSQVEFVEGEEYKYNYLEEIKQ